MQNRIIHPGAIMAVIVCCGAVSFVVAGGRSPRAAETPAIKSALKFAQTYTNALQAGKGVQVVDEGWDVPAMTKKIFGAALEKHTPAERNEIEGRLAGAVKFFYGNKDLSALWSIGQFQGYAATEGEEGRVSVELEFVIGEKKVPNRIVLSPRGNSWRVVESEMDGKSVVMDLRDGYRKVAANLTPLQFSRLMTKEMEAKAGEKK